MNEIILHGAMRERYGESFKMDVRDPVEAYRALACQLPGFKDMVRYSDFRLIREMPNGNFAITEEMLFLGMSNAKLHIIPYVEGAGKGAKGGAKLVLGIALIGVMLIAPPAAGTMFLGMSAQTAGIMAGAALALGGASILLAPTPHFKAGDEDNKDSFLFSGDVNPSGQNIPIPLGFGIFRMPGIPVASQIETNQMSTGPKPIGPGSYINIPGFSGYIPSNLGI